MTTGSAIAGLRLLRVGPAGAERPVAVTDAGAFDLRSVTADIDGAFLADDGIDRVRRAVLDGTLAPTDIAGLRIGPPVAHPSAIWCIGLNYAAHAAESGAPVPRDPVLFFKTPNTVVGPDDDIELPPGSTRTDWEVELAVVIGRPAHRLAGPQDASSVIAGYTMSDDVSERELQLERSGGQWSKGKCWPSFNPLGPALVPADQLDVGDLRLRSWVNGEPRQDSRTSDMIFGVQELIWHLSNVGRLEPGDIVNTGTPQGVALSGRFPYLRDGDVVELEIEGLGRSRSVCRAG